MLSSDGNENSQKTLGLISNETTLHVQHKCSTLFFWTFLCRCFVRRQRETSRNFRVTRFMKEMLYVVLLFTFFSLPLIFTLMAANISHFLTAAIKFSCYSSNEIGVLCFLPLAPALSLQTLELSRKKESALLLLFFTSKSPGGYAMYRRNARVLEM